MCTAALTAAALSAAAPGTPSRDAPPPATAATNGAQGTTERAAQVQFPVHEPFDGPSSSGTTSGDATFVTDGWLRLTSAAGNQAGSWEMNDSFSSSLGFLAEFDYASWGGRQHDGKRGDGLAFFLANGAAANGVGQFGGALGYACSRSSSGWLGGTSCRDDGLPGAYLGIGFDEFGNFSQKLVGNGGPGNAPNEIVVRGGGDGTTGYRYATSAAGPGGTVETTGQSDYRTVRVLVRPSGSSVLLTVSSNTGPGTTMQELITDYDITGITDQPSLPSTLKIGFSASTGGATNNHDIGDLKVNVPVDLSITKSGTPASVPAGSGEVTYTVEVSNDDTNAVTAARVRDAVPGLTGVTWTCAASSGSTCGAPSGSGPLDTTVDLARGGSATYTVTGTAPSSPTTLTNTATVTAPADRTDVHAADNSASTQTTVTDGPADIAAQKEAVGEGPVAPGETFRYTLTAVNKGPADAGDVSVTDALPSGLTFLASPDGCTRSGQTVTCPAKSALAVGESTSWTITVRLDPTYEGDGSDVLNTVTATARQDDPVPGNNTSAAVGPPGGVTGPQADLALTKRAEAGG
ncbi:lectin-like domain-containing protein [Streptomyces sp. KLOTTS4A1]|uniref:lectin-like domain-containing protein n=1 Tax=Streptomyces sp. KLOTTS4A1 TaxID=3390996 RepID=UPI0039F5547B